LSFLPSDAHVHVSDTVGISKVAPFLWDTVELNTPPWEHEHGAHVDSANMVMLKLDHISIRHGVYTLGKSMRDATGLLLHVVVRFLQIPWVDG
jgi:ribulose-5-phosphate 4-epimerase/fuculose-1-phosphate aldolase